jgi:carbamoyltransferase
MIILGISALYHDSSVTVLKDGEIIFASQEERFSRIKHDESFPKKTLSTVIKKFNLSIDKIDFITFYEKPIQKFSRLLDTYLHYAPFNGFESFKKSMPIWLKEKIYQKELIVEELEVLLKTKEKNKILDKLLFCEHHKSHAASAFFASPFKSAAILNIDGVGEYATTSIFLGSENKIKAIKQINYPHSLGLLYSAFTYYLGFKVNSGEYKLMGLAPYGEKKYTKVILNNLINLNDDGSFFLNQKYFDYSTGLKMINKKFENLFKKKTRLPDENIDQEHMNIAASIQDVLEIAIIHIAKNLKKETSEENLCLAGGVALNCVANYKLFKEKVFENIWVQPASSDAGGSLGSSMYLYYNILGHKREVVKDQDSMKGCFLGNEYSDDDIEKNIKKYSLIFNTVTNEGLFKNVAKKLEEGKVVGWFQGKSEFGPRSLGARSILADPRPQDMQKKLNLKIKFRESFRPFAPSVLSEYQNDWFSSEIKNEYMLFINKVLNANINKDKKKQIINSFDMLDNIDSKIAAITHVDLTARVQSVYKSKNPKFHELIRQFYILTGIPLLINTSFNVRGEPIVETPEDAIKCFLGTDIDVLVLNNYIIEKNDQKEYLLKKKHSLKFEKD